MQRVDDPRLPEPPAPIPAAALDDSGVSGRLARLNRHVESTDLVFISATVYDHTRTLLRYSPTGAGRGEISAWSNLDFNCFSGFSTYQVKSAAGTTQEYGLVMAISNENTKAPTTGFPAKRHRNDLTLPDIPNLPDLASGGPMFIVTQGDAREEASVAVLQGLHDLYRVEGARMQAAHQTRTKAQAERRAYLLANPPVPDDITIRFWKRKPLSSDSKKQEVLKP